MKVRNLYFGDIRLISRVENVIFYCPYNPITCSYSCANKTLFYRINRKKVTDLLLGGKYLIGRPEEEKVGMEFADHLENQEIREILHQAGYYKENISKKKLFKILKQFSEEKNQGGNK